MFVCDSAWLKLTPDILSQSYSRRSHCVVSLSKKHYPLLSTASTQEDRKSSRHDWKIIDWNIKQESKY